MNKKIKGFDGVRGLAVISVVLTHTGFWTYLVDRNYLDEALLPLLYGATAVQVFFILSGFLITLLLINEYEKTGTVSIKKFIIRRTLRIFPLYILFLIIATLLHVFGRNVTSWSSLFYAYLYIYNFVPTKIYTFFLGHTWSLAVEEHFYIIWPIVYFIFRKMTKILVFLIIISILASIVVYYQLYLTELSNKYFINRWSFIAGYDIALGCMGAIIMRSSSYMIYLNILFKKNIIFIFGMLVYISSVFLYGNYWFVDKVLSGYVRSIGILIMIIWLFSNQDGFIVKVLEFSPLKYIGLISYGIYMYQGLFLATGPYRDPSQSWPLDPSIGIILVVISAPLSYQYFEKPFLRLKHFYR
jgi:peptidoglycan/LPS O-acetylase OafA/YrhL